MSEVTPILLIVSSPSGAGKTTLCHRLLDEFPRLRFSVSHTTRPMRDGEVDGRDYHFVDTERFEAMVSAARFIEWAHVHGNRYGTAHDEVAAASREKRDVIFDVDYQGAARIKAAYPDAVAIFVLPPSLEVLHERLARRGTETPESLERRFRNAIGEIGHHEEFDHLVVNDDLDLAYEQLRAIYIAAPTRLPSSRHLARAMLDSAR